MSAEERTCAVLGEFAEPEPLLQGARQLREAGWCVETFTPFPIDGLEEATGFDGKSVGTGALIGAVCGLVLAIGIQVGPNLDYPLDVGGRPLIAVPAFTLVTLVIAILGAAFGAVGTVFVGSRLPRLHHPLFNVERFGLASDDRFFLAVLAEGEDFDAYAARAALWRLQPVAVSDVPELRV